MKVNHAKALLTKTSPTFEGSLSLMDMVEGFYKIQDTKYLMYMCYNNENMN